jgi:hypothetical protein
MNIIDKIYDDTKNGVPNYSFSMTDGRRLYYSGVQMNPMPVTGDAINFTIVSTKTSAKGNQYSTIKDVEVIKNPDGHNDAPQQLSNVVENVAPIPSEQNNSFSKSDNQSLMIFVTGLVGRSMQSGHFSAEDIPKLTSIAVRAFNENLKKL